MILSGYQDRSPKSCFKIVNVPGGVDIGIDDDCVISSHLRPELGDSIYHISLTCLGCVYPPHTYFLLNT